MSELIATVNTSTAEHKEDMRRLRAELQSQKEAVDRLRATEADSSQRQVPPNAASAGGGSAPRTRQRKLRRRCEDPYRNEPDHLRFRVRMCQTFMAAETDIRRSQHCIERHLLYMLKLHDYGCLGQLAPPPSDDDITAFKRRYPGCITSTPDSFRIDLSRSRDSAFNVEAIRVFAKDFKHKVIEGEWYSFPVPLPHKYLELEYIELSLYLHLHYVKEVYVTQKKPLSERHKKLRNAARSTRKTRVCEE